MAWETRERGDRYYTRSKRVNGRVVREYVGTGDQAELEALEDERRREERVKERLEFQAMRDEAEGLDGAFRDLDRVCAEAIAETLASEGFHQHKGQWRRRRES